MTKYIKMSALRKELRKTVSVRANKSTNNKQCVLHLAMIGCEDTCVYGPEYHTASMCLTLICRAIETKFSHINVNSENMACNDLKDGSTNWEVKISIYNGKQMDFPTKKDLDEVYHGVILPGSLSSAYDGTKEAWIAALQDYIQTEIHANKRKTLGICFGHQIMAHSFSSDNGMATKCPHGPQVGLYPSIELTPLGNTLSFQQSSFKHLLVTHSDMVRSLPSCASPLAGTAHVPIIAAAYFTKDDDLRHKPYAITFQAHPEYGTDQKTFINVVNKMQQNEIIDLKSSQVAKENAERYSECIEQCSIEVMISAGTSLRWF